jgi:hypothetical protein
VERTAIDHFVDTAAAWFSRSRRLPLLWREQANRAPRWRRPGEGATLIGEGIKKWEDHDLGCRKDWRDVGREQAKSKREQPRRAPGACPITPAIPVKRRFWQSI